MKYKAALFDMNGVIVDDESLHEAAFSEVLSSRGFRLDHAKYLKFFAGKTDNAGFIDFYNSEGEELSDLKVLGTEKSSAYQKLASGQLTPYPGIIDYINGLRLKGIRLSLVTSSIRVEAEKVIEVLGLSDVFETTITANDITHSKPSPEGYLKGVYSLNLDPAECFIIEDAPSGVEAANKAGIACIAVTNTHSPADLSKAQLIVDKLDGNIVLP